MKDNIVDRDALQEQLIMNMIDEMDLKTMRYVLFSYFNSLYNEYTIDKLIEEAEGYYPGICEENKIPSISELESTADDPMGIGK
tara:strand:+ start:510 stop:761 length:252 start_codon:yes stop_codon:yes gene_type:complete